MNTSCNYSCANKISLHISLFANIHQCCCTQFLFKKWLHKSQTIRVMMTMTHVLNFFFHWIHFYINGLATMHVISKNAESLQITTKSNAHKTNSNSSHMCQKTGSTHRSPPPDHFGKQIETDEDANFSFFHRRFVSPKNDTQSSTRCGRRCAIHVCARHDSRALLFQTMHAHRLYATPI